MTGSWYGWLETCSSCKCATNTFSMATHVSNMLPKSFGAFVNSLEGHARRQNVLPLLNLTEALKIPRPTKTVIQRENVNGLVFLPLKGKGHHQCKYIINNTCLK